MARSATFSDYFSTDYFQARQRFVDFAASKGMQQLAIPVTAKGPNGEALTINLAWQLAKASKRCICVTSGLHGVETFFGSAVQLALLDALPKNDEPRPGLLLVHSLNPYGFAHLRRFDENNVDLNRNFLLTGQAFTGMHPLYKHIISYFKLEAPPSRRESFNIRATALILRHGMATLKQSLPIGQYEFPQALFFGGKSPAELQHLLRQQLPAILNSYEEVLHFDLHTGLGPFGSYKILVDDDAARVAFHNALPQHSIEHVGEKKTAYVARGTFGAWLRELFPQISYHYTTFEFGTYNPRRLAKVLLNETRAHFHLSATDPTYGYYKKQLVEAFAPASNKWRNKTVGKAVEVIEKVLR